jgi:MoaA/NifB/PqqE/SkfB family radical SAM enzyme
MDTNTVEQIKRSFVDPGIGPETIALMMTSACNLECLYCRGGRPRGGDLQREGWGPELTTEEWFAVFEDARDFQVKEINLGGLVGDPFCKKDIVRILQKIKGLGFVGSMTTNGSLLNEKVAEVMTECGWDIMLLSLDSVTPEIQQKVRPALDQKPYFQNILRFLDALEPLGSKLRILLNVVITRFNYKTLPEILKFAERHKNIESVHVLKMLYSGQKDYDAMQLSEREQEEFKALLRASSGEKKLAYAGNWLDEVVVRDGAGGQAHPHSHGANVGKEIASPCFTNYYILSIDANGDILQCPQLQNPVAGMNVKKMRLKKLWTGDHLKFRQQLKESAPCFSGCCTILKEQNKMISRTLMQNGTT